VTEYRVTFGQQYPREPHPHWSEANKDGWLTIIASTHIRAREVAFAFLGNHWSDVVEATAFDDWSIYPMGELARITVPTPSFTCRRCGAVSYHPKNVTERYCGACHKFDRDDEAVAL
jgi:hypothetical protein